ACFKNASANKNVFSLLVHGKAFTGEKRFVYFSLSPKYFTICRNFFSCFYQNQIANPQVCAFYLENLLLVLVIIGNHVCHHLLWLYEFVQSPLSRIYSSSFEIISQEYGGWNGCCCFVEKIGLPGTKQVTRKAVHECGSCTEGD